MLKNYLNPQEYRAAQNEVDKRINAPNVLAPLPTPHEKQKAFINSSAKRKVIVSGRRGGKTTGVSLMATARMMEGKRVLYAAPTQDQTDAFWEACKKYFQPGIAAGDVYQHETKRILKYKDGRIRAKTAHDADSLRGDYADELFLEEWSYMKEDAWNAVGAPMLLDNNGNATFIFTPNRKNHAHRTYLKAKADTSGRWEYWHFTSYDNPHLSAAALEEITSDLTGDMHRQEIMAEFLEGEGSIFRNIGACMNAPLEVDPKEHKDHYIVAGIDWGKTGDYTAISMGCVDCQVEIARDRFNQIDYLFQVERIKKMIDPYPNYGMLPERNSMGEPIIETLQRDGLLILRGPDGKNGFMTTSSTKNQLIENLSLTLEEAEWQFQSDPIWTAELEAYERTSTSLTGRSQYNAPAGMHDDTVLARALMRWAAETPRPKDLYAFV